jgi:predicted secreted Zn-dependent protease
MGGFGLFGVVFKGRLNSLTSCSTLATNSPVMAGMVKKPWNYAYSSVHTHLSGHGNLGIVKVNRRLDLIDD